jgi:hypothetical protein
MKSVEGDLKCRQQEKPTYQRRRPESTPCYRIIQQHWETFLEARNYEGKPLPKYIKDEFDAYLKCGIPAFGFLRLKCQSCDQEKIVAFSCKKRGFCPSCCARRMNESAAHLVDHVLPIAPYRQFVITLPYPLRYWCHFNSKLRNRVHSHIVSSINQHYLKKAKKSGIKNPKTGAISFTQRWGSALNLNLHWHILYLDGIYNQIGNDTIFHNLAKITESEVEGILKQIVHKVLRYLRRSNFIDKEGELVKNPALDPLFEEHQVINDASAMSIAGKIAFGPNAGKYVRRIGSGFGYEGEIPYANGKKCYSQNGFSIHANTSTNSHTRDRLEKLISYIARGPLSNQRLEITDDNQVKLRLKKAFSDGTTHLKFTFEEFIEKLVAIIPPPRCHLSRWVGCFAPNSPIRDKIVINPEEAKGFDFQADVKGRNYSWSQLLARVFKIDVLECECGGVMKPMGQIKNPESIRRYLKHINIGSDPPARVPPAMVQEEIIYYDYE